MNLWRVNSVLSVLSLAALSGTTAFAARTPVSAVHSPAARREFTIVYLQRGAVWRARAAEEGETVRLVAPASRICSVPYSNDCPWLRLAVSRNGARAAIDPGNGSGVYLIDVRPGTKPHWLRGVEFPSFSQDGSKLAVSSVSPPIGASQFGKSVSILDITSGRWRVLRKKSEWPVWSRDGLEIAMLEDAGTDPEGEGGIVVADAVTGAVKFAASRAICPAYPVISPDNRYVGVVHELSRPKMGHFFLDRRTGRPALRNFDYPNRLPAVLQDWSPDSKYALWDWRAPDPKNDGRWLWDEVGLTSIRPGMARWVDLGFDPKFSPDARWIGYLRMDRKVFPFRHATLCVQAFTGGTRIRLIKNVTAFAFAR